MVKKTSLVTIALAALIMGGTGCATAGPPSAVAGPEPMLSVERFLQASNSRDLEVMAHIFGTSQGSMAQRTGSPFGCAFRRMGSWVGASRRCVSWQAIEVRMNTIAMILQHDDYQVRSENSVAGRRSPTRRVGVDLERSGRRFQDVPFVVVRDGNGRWLIEEIGLDRVTGAR